MEGAPITTSLTHAPHTTTHREDGAMEDPPLDFLARRRGQRNNGLRTIQSRSMITMAGRSRS